MTKLFLPLFLIFNLASQIAVAQRALPASPKDYVYDEINLFNSEEKNILNQKLTSFEKETGGQMVLAIFSSLANENFEDYVNRVFRHWGIGKKDKNNGVLIVVVPNDRQYRTEVGAGYEGVLTDVITASLQREILIPAFREGKFTDGLSTLIDEYSKIIKSNGEYVPEINKTIRVSQIIRLVIFIIILFMFLGLPFMMSPVVYGAGNRRRGSGWWGGSGWGGGSSGGGGFSGGGGWSGGGGSSGKW